jgi:hypothetical protein
VTISSTTVENNTAVAGANAINAPGFSGPAGGGGIYINSGTATLSNDTVEYNTGGWLQTNAHGSTTTIYVYYNGGIDIASGATVYLDTFTVDHTINNQKDNIEGSYILQP